MTAFQAVDGSSILPTRTMKTYTKEFGHDYSTYSFGYSVYGILEEGDKLSNIYRKGFLPYSGKSLEKTFYMARSVRIDLTKFTPSSENRRILRKPTVSLERIVTNVLDFDTNDKKFLNFCLQYFEKRHGKGIMNRDRLKYILNFSEKLQVVTYTEDDTVLGYVFEVLDKDMSHFWFSFYDLKLVNTSLGMWLLLDLALHAQKENKKYFYIGTAYGDKGLYKTNFKDLEFWDGNRWVSDVLILKKLCKVDN